MRIVVEETDGSGLSERRPDDWDGWSGPVGSAFVDGDHWRAILGRLGIPWGKALEAASASVANGTSVQAELVASGAVEEFELYEAIADDFGIRHVGAIDPVRMLLSPTEAVRLLRNADGGLAVRMEEGDGRIVLVVVPDRSLPQLRRMIFGRPKVLPRLRFTSPRVMRKALMDIAQPLLLERAREDLFKRHPDMSAKVVADARQGVVIGAGIALLPIALFLDPILVLNVTHLVVSLFFLSCIMLRFAAASAPPTAEAEVAPARPGEILPRYSVLVALYREADVVPQLVASLRGLVWPASKLEVKLVCEADDHETLGALATCRLPPNFEVVAVPAGEPRTKPKALNYALPSVRGSLAVLYDAEDRPHPLQLMEAWRRFEASGPELACLQAPLQIANADASPISRQFAFEYAALFRGLLPWLSGKGVLLPLGGTSNHFRVAALEHVGAWDPYNVTEDADLGFRFGRFGYRTATITLPTLEDAPEKPGIWLKQRTRWFKGWAQTWLVHMRRPGLFLSEVGLRSFVIGQIICAGLLLSALVHPLLFLAAGYLIYVMAFAVELGTARAVMLGIDVMNIVCGYLSFLILGWQSLRRTERHGFWRVVLFTPPYWMMMSAAGWRSIIQLYTNPHLWEKTPHKRSRVHGGGEVPLT
jgi:cellulose synthase/poly-beta-1,6-N-acetylglucosamine synthase-like glycosyltransferase